MCQYSDEKEIARKSCEPFFRKHTDKLYAQMICILRTIFLLLFFVCSSMSHPRSSLCIEIFWNNCLCISLHCLFHFLLYECIIQWNAITEFYSALCLMCIMITSNVYLCCLFHSWFYYNFYSKNTFNFSKTFHEIHNVFTTNECIMFSGLNVILSCFATVR